MTRFDRARCRGPLLALLAAALLSACASRPNPNPAPVVVLAPTPNPTSRSLAPPAAPPASAPARSGAGREAQTPAPAVALPVRPSPPVVFAPLPEPAVPAAVAANFPEPNVTFATPAFQPGRSAFTSNEELAAIVHGLERNAPIGERAGDIGVLPLGFSQGGVPLEALAFTRAPEPVVAAPGVAGAPARRPTVVIVAGQHGDEPAGTEALIAVAQELAAGRLASVLDKVDVVLLPRANPDGASVFVRGASDGTDVNRDHLLLQSPEARAIAQLMVQLAPLVILDLHEYPVGGAFTARFGGVQRFDALLQYATTANMAPFVTKAAEEWFRLPLVASLRSAGLSTDWYATVADAPERRLTMGSIGPQVGRNAGGLRNAVSLLVETRGGGLGRVDLKRRVQTDLVTIGNVLGNAAAHAADLVKLRQFVERDVAAKACQGEAVIEAAPLPSEHALTVLDAETGAIKRVSVAWDSTLELRLLKSRPRPCGYWLAASETDAVQRLRWLGVDVKQLDEAGEVRGESYREIAREPVEAVASGVAPRIRVQAVPALLDLAAGGYYVSLEQPLANLAIAVLEPESPASYASARIIASTAGEARILARPDIRMTALP